MARITGLCVSLLCLTSCTNLYQHDYASLGADYWFAELDGQVDLDSLGLSADIDLQDDLGLGNEDIVNVHGTVQLWTLTLDASYFNVDYSGNEVLSRDITIGGTTFTAGTNVETDFEMLFASAKLKTGLLALGPVAAGVLVGVDYFDLEGKAGVTFPLPVSESQDLQVPFPVVGAVVTANFPLGDTFAAFGDVEASGLYVDGYGIKGGFLDAAARVGIRAAFFQAGAAYRYTWVDVEDTNDDFTWDFNLGGPFLFAEIAF